MKVQNLLALLVIFSSVFVLSVSSVKAFTMQDLFNYISSILAQSTNRIQGAAVLTSGCSGTPSSCSSFGNTNCPGGCTLQERCGPHRSECEYYCTGTPTPCSSFTTQSSCNAQQGCSWLGATITSSQTSATTSSTTTTTPPSQYTVCTYVNPNSINASFYLNGIPVYDGQVIKITPGAAYTIAANTPLGYTFAYWNTARTVFVTNSLLANTTVYFNTTGWDGTCVGNLGANYLSAPTTTTTTSTTTTTPAPGSISYICSSCNTSLCVCNITNCNSGNVNLFSTSDCSGTPFVQIPFYLPAVWNYGLSAGTGYARVFCDNGTSSTCQSYYVAPVTTTTTTTPIPGKCTFGTITATNGLAFGGYTVYSDLGSNGNWARIVIKNSAGNTVDTSVVNQGNSYTSSYAGFKISVVNVRSLQDETVIGVDIYAGPSGANCVSNMNGIEKDNIDINYGNLTDKFPNPLTNAQYNGLQTGDFSYKGNVYNFHEDLQLGNTYFSHDYSTSSIGGAETMVAQSGQIAYEYVFDSPLNCTALATSTQNTCTLTNPEYLNPIKITMVGKPFVIVGIGSNQITMLNGNVGTVTATAGVSFNSYTIYSDIGVNGNWSRILVKDSSGNTIETATINQGDSRDFPTEGFTVKVTDVRALQDGTVVGVDVVVGPVGVVQKTYTTSCDVTNTGIADTRFPGETNWCIQVKSGSFANSGAVVAGDAIQVVYRPAASPQYFSASQSLFLPNNYGEIYFEGFNTNSFATLTFKPITGVTAYNIVTGGLTNSTVAASNLNGIEIDSDTANSLFLTSLGVPSNKAFLLFNSSINNNIFPVMLGSWDSTNNRIGVYLDGGCVSGSSTEGFCTQLTSSSTAAFNITFNYGGSAAAKDIQLIKIVVAGSGIAGCQVSGGSSCTSLIKSFQIGTFIIGNPPYDTFPAGVLLNWVNTTSTWSTSQSPSFRLYTSDSAEPKDVQVLQTPNGGGTPLYFDIGTATQDVVANTGAIVTPSTGSNQVIIKIPSQALAVKAFIGQQTVPNGIHDVDITNFVTPNTAYANQQFFMTATLVNTGDYTEVFPVVLTACSNYYVVQPPVSALPRVSTSTATVGGGGELCQILYSNTLMLASGSTTTVNIPATLGQGSYSLNLTATVSNDPTPANNEYMSYLYVQPVYPTYTINLHQGWNLFSVPVSYVYNANSNCVPTSSIYGLYNGVYYQTTYVSGGSGYWVQLSSDCQLNVSGNNISANDFSYLNAGWNMIGAPSQQVTFTDVIGSCNVTRGPLWYDPTTNSYVSSTTLDPGKGYFLKVNQTCQLGVGLPPPPP